MASEYAIDLPDQVAPEIKGVPRIGVGGRAIVTRDSPGSIGVVLMRGDGGDPEAYTYTLRSRWYGPFEANEVVQVDLAALDLFLPDDGPRRYRMRIIADGGATLGVKSGSVFMATEPYSPAAKA